MALRVSIGQYYSVDSPIHRLDPRAKLVATVVFMVSCFFVSNLPTLVLAAAAVGACIAAARVPAGRLLAQIRPIALFLVITSVINLFFVQAGEPVLTVGALRIYSGGVEAALLYTLRFFLLLLAGSLLMLTTQPVALTDAAEKLLGPLERIGVPVSQVTLVLSIALRFVPTLSQEAKNVVAAQTARGADPRGQKRPRLRPGLRTAPRADVREHVAARREPRPRHGGPLLHRRGGAHPLPRAPLASPPRPAVCPWRGDLPRCPHNPQHHRMTEMRHVHQHRRKWRISTPS